MPIFPKKAYVEASSVANHIYNVNILSMNSGISEVAGFFGSDDYCTKMKEEGCFLHRDSFP